MYRDNKLDSTSIDIRREKLEQLKTIFPEVFCEDQIDFDKLKLILGKSVVFEKERFGLNWSGKADCFKIIQNPTAATLRPCREQSIDFDTTQNLFIEGNLNLLKGDNLEVLKLLQKSYNSKVKMIYIDPPYNTGKEFIYCDDYHDNLSTYLEDTEQKDKEGHRFATNTESDGRYHSKWLSMMYPRLYLAKSLLRDDGVIFISIDDHEQHRLRMICDEIFGEDNFIGTFVVNSTPNARDYGHIAKQHDYVLMYTKNLDFTKTYQIVQKEKTFKYQDDIGGFNIHPLYNSNESFNLDNRPNLFYPFYLNPKKVDCNGFYEITLNNNLDFIEIYPPKSLKNQVQFVWRWGKEKAASNINKEIVGYKDQDGEFRIVQKMRHNTKIIRSILSENSYTTRRGTAEIEELFSRKVFDFPKPISLLKQFIQAATVGCDIILDFFSGSSTTAHAVMKINAEDGGNRKYIMVQLPEKCSEDSEAYKAGYKTIADIGKERIRRVAKKILEEYPDYKGDLGFKVFKLDSSNFKLWNNNTNSEEEYNRQLSLAVDNIKKDRSQEDILYDIILRLGLSLTDTIDVKNFGDKNVFSLRDGKILICLEKVITEQLIEEIIKYNPDKVIFLDIGFQGNDLLKIYAQDSFKNHISENKNKAIEFIVY